MIQFYADVFCIVFIGILLASMIAGEIQVELDLKQTKKELLEFGRIHYNNQYDYWSLYVHTNYRYYPKEYLIMTFDECLKRKN